MIWQIQLLVKDSASQLNKNFFRVMLFSGGAEGAGHEFFGAEHPPCNLYKNAKELDYLTKQLASM
jgi:hypothetical protein